MTIRKKIGALLLAWLEWRIAAARLRVGGGPLPLP